MLLMIKKIDPKERRVVTHNMMMKHTYKIHSIIVQNIVSKLLGINWDTLSDYFVLEFANIVEAANRLQIAKHNILKISAMFFDPLVVVCPIVLNAKVLFQETCKQKISWAAVIPIDINNKWKVIINELFNLDKIETNAMLCVGANRILNYMGFAMPLHWPMGK